MSETKSVDGFMEWWAGDGKYYDPDTDDVPWFDKRRDLAAYAYAAGIRSVTLIPPQNRAKDETEHYRNLWIEVSRKLRETRDEAIGESRALRTALEQIKARHSAIEVCHRIASDALVFTPPAAPAEPAADARARVIEAARIVADSNHGPNTKHLRAALRELDAPRISGGARKRPR